jgi:hypothetical protein
LRDVAGRFGTSKSALARHAGEHLETKLARAKAAVSLSAESLWSRVLELQHATEEVLRDAQATKSHAIALKAIQRAAELLELQGKILVAARGGSSPSATSAVEDALDEIRRRRERRRLEGAIATTTTPLPPRKD